ncbi:hypothetical protein [Erwinia sp. S59]|uniref:hypothetical protein n=1 Tax=Erwinia sp. S59 TaxID=2769340 RepID=UPI00190A6065|nr:hypothetical protein [Erwinia sp. S59]MBK0092814.1 hypothetical protein [Erwinia sp. S59]
MADLLSSERMDVIVFLRDGERGRSKTIADSQSRAIETQVRRIAAQMGREIAITRGAAGEKVVTFLNGRSPAIDDFQ